MAESTRETFNETTAGIGSGTGSNPSIPCDSRPTKSNKDMLETDAVASSDEINEVSNKMRETYLSKPTSKSESDYESESDDVDDIDLVKELPSENLQSVALLGNNELSDQEKQHQLSKQTEEHNLQQSENEIRRSQGAIPKGHNTTNSMIKSDAPIPSAAPIPSNNNDEIKFSTKVSSNRRSWHSSSGSDDCAVPIHRQTSSFATLDSHQNKRKMDLPQTASVHAKDDVPKTAYQEEQGGEQQEPSTTELRENKHYDILLLYSDEDSKIQRQFSKKIRKNGWEVATKDHFPLTMTKLRAFNALHQRSSYTVLLLTTNFLIDVWCDRNYQIALVQSIEDPQKNHTILPVICEDNLNMPMDLSVLTSLKLTNPNFNQRMMSCVNVAKRAQREKDSGLTPTVPKSKADSSSVAKMSMGELYRFNQPDLDIGPFASQVITNHDTYRQVCIRLNVNSLNNWHVLADNVGFETVMDHDQLEREQNPTRAVLETFFQKEFSTGSSPATVLRCLREILHKMGRLDVVDLLTEE